MQKLLEILPLNLAGFRRGASPRMPGACVTLMGLRLPEDLKPTVDNQQQAQVSKHTPMHHSYPILVATSCLHHSLSLLRRFVLKFDCLALTHVEILTMEPATCYNMLIVLCCVCRLWAQHWDTLPRFPALWLIT